MLIPGAIGGPGLPIKLGFDPGHDHQQGRLTSFVVADHADLGVG